MENDKTIIASGCFFLAKDTGRVLLAKRSKAKSKYGSWGAWGGKNENNESNFECLQREILEETGHIPLALRVQPFDIYESDNKLFQYYTYIWVTPHEFTPIINDEHEGFKWVEIGKWPDHMHNGARLTLSIEKNIKKLHEIREAAPDIPVLPCITNILHKI